MAEKDAPTNPNPNPQAQPNAIGTSESFDPADAPKPWDADGIDKPDREAGQNVQSVTTEVPHEADASSAPGPYDLPINRPPVSTNDPRTPIAHSLVAGAGAPHTEGQDSGPRRPGDPERPAGEGGMAEAPTASKASGTASTKASTKPSEESGS